MKSINLTNSSDRDAVVGLEGVRIPKTVRWVDQRQRPAVGVRVLKEPIERSAVALIEQCGSAERLSQALIDGDPELDCELIGMFLRETSRVYIDADQRITHRVNLWDIVRNPDGTQRERRPAVVHDPNVAAETPLRWSGKFIKKIDALRKFVIIGKRQLVHVNGLTYDFLYAIAQELEEKDSLMMLGAGPKGNQPLVLRRGGSPYRGLLEGRTQGDQYCLLLHLTNMELKIPKESASNA